MKTAVVAKLKHLANGYYLVYGENFHHKQKLRFWSINCGWTEINNSSIEFVSSDAFICNLDFPASELPCYLMIYDRRGYKSNTYCINEQNPVEINLSES